MKVDVSLPSANHNKMEVYLDGMKEYPDPKCKPVFVESYAQFALPLKNFFECGVTRMVNNLNVSCEWNFKQNAAKRLSFLKNCRVKQYTITLSSLRQQPARSPSA